ncbi:MAG: hypothetical protein PHV28_12855 [Kiritimatiellae bacterium]|nr:hypothetical protein [Kiritimatiellia bacterium]
MEISDYPNHSDVKKWTRETRSSDLDTAGCRVETVIAESSDYSAFTNSITVYDFLGRAVSVTTPLGITSNFYSGASDRLVRVSRTGQPDTLYEYETGSAGVPARTVLDVDGDGQVSYSGPDRITAADTRYEEDASNVWWRVTRQAVWAETNSAACVTSSVTRVRMTGLGTDTSGLPGIPDGTILTAQIERIDWRGNVTRDSTYTDAGQAAVWIVTETPRSAQPAMRKSVAGRPVSAVSSSSVTNSYTFDGFGRQVSATDGRGNTTLISHNELGQVACIEDAATNRTTYTYDELSRQVAVSSPLSNTVFTAYDSLGNVIRTWGATYPVEYGYDTRNLRVSMKTFRDENGDGDETRWLYDGATGLLTNKVYADGKGTAYGYTTSGLLATRTWARGVTTDYSYDTLGQLIGIEYSDSTPDVAFGYDRIGRLVSAITVDSTNLFEYSVFEIESETQNGVAITRYYDSGGRHAGFELGDGFAFSCGYDIFGRLSSLQSASPAGTELYQYAYCEGTDFVVSMTNSAGFWWRRVYEQNRDLIVDVKNGFNGSTVSDFAYFNDPGGHRARRVDSGAVTNLFAHNVRSEIVGAVMGTNAYEYDFDQIGNRLYEAFNSETNLYASNPLNQYTNITDGTGTIPAYDADGNMLTNGVWSFTWDAENRLVSAMSNAVCVIINIYDHQSRRIAKVTSEETRAFIWDGWNMTREVIDQGSTASTNHHVWGLDLSGSLQGAGGVGGLLAENKDGVPYFPCFDANGNVTEFVNENGDVRAHYEYSPFGEITAQSGDMADAFTHRFSTKPFDVETGIVMYELRPYEPGLGRWLCRDPIGETGGLNIYTMTGNNPVDAIDQYGMGEWSFQVNKKLYWEGHGVSVNVSYSLDETERKCCQKTMIKRWVKSMFGIMGGKYGDFWFDADIEDVLAGAGHFVAIAPDDNPEGPNILGYRVRWTQLFRFEAVCIKGPYAGKVLSTSEREYRTEGHWAGKDFKGYFLQ